MVSRNTKYRGISRSNSKSVKQLSKSAIGAISEYEAICSLVKQGYMVAKSIDPQCIFDLVAIKPNGTVRLIDVKTKSYRKKNNHNIHRSPNEKQKQLGVELMVMDQKNILKDLEHNKNLVKENKLTVEQNKYKKNRKEQKCYKSFADLKDLVTPFINKDSFKDIK
tara:strand:+ start:201 stop:695 length:495 start_codon:yes stop_codon:yes gene_type:complete